MIWFCTVLLRRLSPICKLSYWESTVSKVTTQPQCSLQACPKFKCRAGMLFNHPASSHNFDSRVLCSCESKMYSLGMEILDVRTRKLVQFWTSLLVASGGSEHSHVTRELKKLVRDGALCRIDFTNMIAHGSYRAWKCKLNIQTAPSYNYKHSPT